MVKSKKENPRICLVLPHANSHGHDHFDHVAALAREVNRIRPHGAIAIGLGSGRTSEASRWERTLLAPARWMGAVAKLREAHMNGYTVFFVHYSYLGMMAARWVTSRLGGKTLYWHCGQPWLYVKEDPWGSGWVLRAVLKSADLVVTGSSSLRAEYASRFGLGEERVAELPSWVAPWTPTRTPKPVLRRRLGLPVKGKIALFAHRLSVDRGCLLLPELVSRVREQIPGVRWVVVGDGPEREAMIAKAARLGVRDAMDFRGWVEHSAMQVWFAACDVLVVPSLRAGVPRNILEAFTVGLPVVATKVGATADLFQGGLSEYCVEPDDLEGLSRGVVTLLARPERARSFTRMAVDAARPHHVGAVARRLISLVDGLR